MLQRLKALLKYKGFVLYSKPYQFNIVGLRSKSTIPNRFDDELHVFYTTSPLHWEYHVFKITTDPGTFWLENPMQEQGTAILAEGQYKNAYAIGLHQGKYEALVQQNPVTIMRDYDRNAILDFYNGKKMSGLFSINIHRANSTGTTKTVDKNSAGCQVFENASDFATFMQLCKKHEQRYGNQFTYTLIDFRSWRRQSIRRAGFFAAGLLGVGAAGYYLYTQQNRKTNNKQNKKQKNNELLFKKSTERQNQRIQFA
ncbi:MAG: hypothetical protein KF900_09380 [Bacteroidetes bacterium]|nr:hypothetical protein [Bacteroidota bacterium]